MGKISIYIHFHHQTQRRLLTGSMVSLISEVSTSQQRSTSSGCCRAWDGDDLEDVFFFLYDQMMKQENIWKCTHVLMDFFFFQLCMSHQLYYDDYRFYHCEFFLSVQKWKYPKFNKFQIGNN